MKLRPLVRVLLSVLAAFLFWGCSAESKRAKTLDRAAQYFKAMEWEKARIEYQNVLQTDPNHVEANERMGQIWLEQGSPMRAASYLSRLRTIAPGNQEMRLKLARIILALGGTAEARRDAVTVLERSTSFPDALVLLTETVRGPEDLKQAEQFLARWPDKASVPYLTASANIMALRGDADGARAAYLRAITRDPKGVEARLAFANFLAGQNFPVEARAEFKRAAESAPGDANTRLRYAAYLSQNGGAAEAVAYLNEMTRQLPNFLPAWRSLAELAIAARKYDEAQTHLQTVFAKDPADYEGRLLRNRIWLAQGETKRAIEDLEKFGQEFPGLGIEKHQLALAYLQSNDGPAATKVLQEVVVRNPDNLDAQLQLAQLNMRSGATQAAGIAMLNLVTRRPAYVPAYPVLIDALRVVGRLDQAEVALERGIKVAPKNFQLHFMMGAVRTQLKMVTEARQSFETVLTLEPSHQGAMAELVGLDLKDGKPAEALRRAQALVAKAPNSAAARVVEARVHAYKSDWGRAETTLLKAIELEPNQIAAYGLLAETYRARKDDPATAARVDSLLSKHAGEEMAVVVAAQYFSSVGNAAKARQAYEAFLTTKPNAAEVLNNLANLYLDPLKDLDRALETARKARAAAAGSGVIADTLGWILYQKKAYAEALPLINEAASRIGHLAEVQYHLGMVNLRLGHDEVARTALRLAAAGAGSYPGKDEVIRELAALEKRLPAKAP